MRGRFAFGNNAKHQREEPLPDGRGSETPAKGPKRRSRLGNNAKYQREEPLPDGRGSETPVAALKRRSRLGNNAKHRFFQSRLRQAITPQ